MDIFTKSSKVTASVVQEDHKLVIVHDGSRGPQGEDGDKGDQGDQGDSIRITGQWGSGQTYCPGDAVSWRSSLLDHVTSLYIQFETTPCSVSTTPPNQDPGRWEEIGATDWDSAFGGIWQLMQLGHGFTMVGQPVGYSFQSDSYVLADARNLDELGICVVREVIDQDRVLLQSTGEVPGIDPAVIYPPGSSWEPGRVYYVSSVRGFVSRDRPTDGSYYENPILLASDLGAGGNRNGVALPWTPSGGPGVQSDVLVGLKKFYYVATAGQTVFTGPDRDGKELSYTVGPNTDVFLRGLNLVETDEYTATDGVTVTLATGANLNDIVEIWTPDQPISLVVDATAAKVDNIESQFDGQETSFKLLVSATPLSLTDSTNVQIWLDVNPQEPEVDYVVEEDPLEAGTSQVTFAFPPPAGTRFWGIVYQPVSSLGASEVSYNNATSGMTATNVQAAIDELEARVTALEP